MKYNHTNPTDRVELAKKIKETLLTAGFHKVPNAGEDVYERAHHKAEDIVVRVYTSVYRGEVRESGEDAIRVAAIYNGRGIAKATRINRTGDMEKITERLLERMREVYGKVPSITRCPRCGAPQFVSKNGNLVCADLCWKTK